jgi:hypothetical protein
MVQYLQTEAEMWHQYLACISSLIASPVYFGIKCLSCLICLNPPPKEIFILLAYLFHLPLKMRMKKNAQCLCLELAQAPLLPTSKAYNLHWWMLVHFSSHVRGGDGAKHFKRG